MIEVELKSGQLLKLHGGAESMPRINEFKFNYHLSLEYGVGSDLNSIVKHYTKVSQFIATDNKENALKELDNLMLNHQSMIDQIDHLSRAFASIVHSIDNEKNEDLSDEGLDLLIEKIPQIESREMRNIIDKVKKNLNTN